MKRVLFLMFTALLAAAFFVALGLDANREWIKYQRRFFKTVEKSARRGITGGIHQTIVKPLNRVDRCATCHLAIDKPPLALAEEPFTAHPGDYLKWHPVEKFGCTVCHGGQGLATEVKSAHGEVPHWEEPLLRGGLVQASCRQCHGDLAAIQTHAPLLADGQQLFRTKGCFGCHAVHDFGQSVSVDLSEVGSKSHQLIEADFEMMPSPHNRIHWLRRKLAHPRTLNPGVPQDQLPQDEEEVFPSVMPYFGFDAQEIEALTVYLLSLKADTLPATYVRPDAPALEMTYTSAVQHGRAVYEKYGCSACHGLSGVGGRRNPNNGLGEEIPSLLYVKAFYDNDIEALKTVIREGRQPSPRTNIQRPNPGLYMPAWKERISDQDLEALIAYLFALSDRLPSVTQPAAAPEAPEAPAT